MLKPGALRLPLLLSVLLPALAGAGEPVAAACAFIDALPPSAVGEIHLAGFDASGPCLIDTHGAPIDGAVWRLYQRLVVRTGPRPTLIERDDNVPAYADLAAERDAAARILAIAQEAALVSA